jgi:hypothetical protein
MRALQNATSDGRLDAAGAQESQHANRHVSLPGTVGVDDAERSGFAEVA